ncbi:MAG: hypothetical protein VX294_05185 [Candidatus Latescibacterota bacterium]|nr:hypothetical protein [Candidatus Latescibacterota bacterium]
MTTPTLFENLESIASQLLIEIRYEDIDNTGGLCRIGNSQVIIINRDLDINQTQTVIATALSRCSIDQLFIPPKVREFIALHSN